MLGHLFTEPVARETLLHFTARLGLENVAGFLLKQPGGVETLCLPNKQGHLPVEIAKAAGWGRLVELFLRYPCRYDINFTVALGWS